MYLKLTIKNAKRSIKNYLIYLVTMTICVALFYAFLSISSAYYNPSIGTAYDLTMLADNMKLPICMVTFLLIFLIRYVNRYLLIQRQKEFAVQSILGMEQRTIGWLFFAETLGMGVFSIVSGILPGMIVSQFITAMLLSDYGQNYQFSWMLFPDTVIFTVIFFLCCFLLVGFFNLHTIRNIKIIDMLSADRQNGPALRKSRFMHVLMILYLILLAWMLFSGYQMISFYFDPRFELPVHILFLAIIILPALGILWPLVWISIKLLCKKTSVFSRLRAFYTLVAVEMLFTILIAVSAACVPAMKNSYMLSYGSGVMKQYLTYLTGNVLFLVCELFYLSGLAIAAWKERSSKSRYKGENLFFYGQILSKLTANTKSMILICMTLILSMILFLSAPVLSAWSLGYLEERSRYDVQISSEYNKSYEESSLPQGSYEAVTRFLEDKRIPTAFDQTFSLYLPTRREFRSRIKWEFPVLAVSLSDYNAIRQMLGYEPMSLDDHTFTTQWQSIATDDQKTEFLNSHKEVSTDAGILTLADNACQEASIGENIYNIYTDVIYIFPDSICKKLLGVRRCRYIQLADPLSFADAQALEKSFTAAFPDDTASADSTGVQYTIRLHTLEVNSILCTNFILKAVMIYGAVTLMVICLTILSLQQLQDASRYPYRFLVLRELGVEESHISRLIFKQLGVWFGLPVALALLTGIILISGFLQTISAQIAAYIGISALLEQLAVTSGILMLLLICYFISTWILFRHATKP